MWLNVMCTIGDQFPLLFLWKNSTLTKLSVTFENKIFRTGNTYIEPSTFRMVFLRIIYIEFSHAFFIIYKSSSLIFHGIQIRMKKNFLLFSFFKKHGWTRTAFVIMYTVRVRTSRDKKKITRPDRLLSWEMYTKIIIGSKRIKTADLGGWCYINTYFRMIILRWFMDSL